MNKPNLALVFIVVGFALIQLYANWQIYTAKVDQTQLEEQYLNSQYANPASSTWIDDPPLYKYAGSRYVAGDSPDQINFELQPFTKYLFGLSIKIFGNPEVLQLALYIWLINQTYQLANSFGMSRKYAILPALLVAIDPLIRSHASRAYLDLTMTNFIMYFLRNFPKASSPKLGILIGLIALAKSFMIGGIVYVALNIYRYIYKEWQLKPLLVVTCAAVCTYLVGYVVFFWHGNSFLDFLSLHINILRLYRSYVPEYPKGEIIRIIWFGQWRKWFDDFSLAKVPEWSIMWPLSFASSLLVGFHNRLNFQHNRVFVISLIFSALYGTSIMMKLVFPRYLIPVLPIMYSFLGLYFFGKPSIQKVQ